MTNVNVAPTEARSTRGSVPINVVKMDAEDMDISINEASISFVPGQHDQVKISAVSTTLETTDGMLDSPISFLHGMPPHVETFNGYVVDVTEEQTSQGTLSFKLVIFGATKVMYEGMPRYWSNKTIPNAIRDLAYRNLLGFSGHDHTHLWKALAQTSESDWTIVNRFARRIGYSVFNRYGVVLCYNPMDLIRESGVYTRLVSGGRLSDAGGDDRNLIEFTPSEKADVIEQNLGIRYGYFTTDGAVQIAASSGKFKGYVFEADVVVRDQTESSIYTTTKEILTTNWKQHATARIWGDADLYPGMCVEIVTANTRYLRDKYDGKWLIYAVGHQMDRQQYQSLLYLCRPSSTMSVPVTTYRPFWVGGDSRGRPRPVFTLDQGQWVSSWADRRVRSLL
jgi:hypothetical protein